jgi:hypothetical protein
LITSVGNLGGFVGPSLIGAAAKGARGIPDGLAMAGVALVLSAALVLLLPGRAADLAKIRLKREVLLAALWLLIQMDVLWPFRSCDLAGLAAHRREMGVPSQLAFGKKMRQSSAENVSTTRTTLT